GEIDMMIGRRSLVRARAQTPCEVLEIPLENLRRMVQIDAELSEIFLRAFILRRAELISKNVSGLTLIGSNHSAGTLRLKRVLTRNGQPHPYLDVDRDPGVLTLLEHFHIEPGDIPVLTCGQSAMRNPSNAEAAACLGFNEGVDDGRVHDVIVVGAGPAGLA